MQAVGKIPIDVNAMNIDLLSISGHKLYGPKGVGAIYIRRRPRVRLEAQMSGGGQERGLRSGTVPHFLAVGACLICSHLCTEVGLLPGCAGSGGSYCIARGFQRSVIRARWLACCALGLCAVLRRQGFAPRHAFYARFRDGMETAC